MPYETGTVNSPEELIAAIRRFACGYPSMAEPVFTGSGAGTLTSVDGTTSSVAETWTLTVTTAPSAPATTTHLSNAGAENGDMTDWAPLDHRAGFSVLSSSDAYEGAYIFYGGATGGYLSTASYQQIDLVADGLLATDIDEQAVVFDLTWRDSNLTNSSRTDPGRVYLRFLDSSQVLISEHGFASSKLMEGWVSRTIRETCPVGARYVDVVMEGFLADGTTINYYVDAIVATTEVYPARISVVGSVTGSLGTGSVHSETQAYSHLVFLFDDPDLTMATSDKFDVVLTTGELAASGQEWTEHRYIRNAELEGAYGANSRELILEGPGASGTDSIFVGMRSYTNVSYSLYDIFFNGFTGYLADNDFENQPGGLSRASGLDNQPLIPMLAQPMTYWLFVSGRRIMGVVKVGNYYEHFYLGFIKPYYTPAQFPYPLVVAGSSMDTAYNIPNHSDISIYHKAYWDCCRNYKDSSKSALRFRDLTGNWRGMYNQTPTPGQDAEYSYYAQGVWPWAWKQLDALAPNLDGGYPLFPAVLNDGAGDYAGQSHLHGEFEGLYATAGRDNLAENTITLGGDVYMVFPNTFHSGDNDFCAVKME
jgi:hypothetical protein